MFENNIAQRILNLVIVIGTISGLILSLTIQPEFLHIFSIVTYFVVFIYICVYVIRGSIGLSQFWRWVILGVFYIGTIPFFIWVGSWSKSPNNTVAEASNFPFQVTVYDFENPEMATDVAPWFSVPEPKSYKTLISQDFAHSGKSSLQLFADMQSAAANPETEYAGIGLKGEIPLHTKAIVAWIFIPTSEPIKDVVFKAHLLSYDKKDDGTKITFTGEDTIVKLGTWTPLFLGFSGETELASNRIVWDGKIDEAYLSIWSDRPYKGSIYVDDFSVYR